MHRVSYLNFFNHSLKITKHKKKNMVMLMLRRGVMLRIVVSSTTPTHCCSSSTPNTNTNKYDEYHTVESTVVHITYTYYSSI